MPRRRAALKTETDAPHLITIQKKEHETQSHLRHRCLEIPRYIQNRQSWPPNIDDPKKEKAPSRTETALSVVHRWKRLFQSSIFELSIPRHESLSHVAHLRFGRFPLHFSVMHHLEQCAEEAHFLPDPTLSAHPRHIEKRTDGW